MLIPNMAVATKATTFVPRVSSRIPDLSKSTSYTFHIRTGHNYSMIIERLVYPSSSVQQQHQQQQTTPNKYFLEILSANSNKVSSAPFPRGDNANSQYGGADEVFHFRLLVFLHE